MCDGNPHEEFPKIDACGRGGDIPKAMNRSAGDYLDHKACDSQSEHQCSDYIGCDDESTG